MFVDSKTRPYLALLLVLPATINFVGRLQIEMVTDPRHEIKGSQFFFP